ncbi:SigE family RNA polymerase sigma factor [Actinomadura rupiterrae]|uniref:SigE family RNA polymerase sigma factor n=1 Tax=Actinomadura rupiterrae TaxID=559627 RepID=UPI0020A5DE6F|nr:SigE family RNA polymerase sigma factor [Actinomadura rupiterrae]MCP2336159.1 RNA polymerase sigma-70 factor (sigma-E family) [Actinomadura rupiterrae]
MHEMDDLMTATASVSGEPLAKRLTPAGAGAAAEDGDDGYTAYVSGRVDWIRRTAYLLCGDWTSADDLAQQTIYKLYVHWAKARRAESLDAYTRVVLVREFLAERRKAWWRRTSLVAPPDLPAAAPADPERGLDLRNALTGLGPRQRATVVLRYYCDLSVAETAAVLGCSEGNVKSQTARALATLRGSLEDR